MKSVFIPRTILGRWSLGLMMAFFVFMAVFAVAAVRGADGGDTFFSNLALSLPVLLAAICGAASFVIGLIAMIRSKERAILVMLATVVGCNVLLFALGEILFPH